ncbi:hypothetical protein ACFE04_004376 [Oxalis oulophora]
MGFGGDTIYDWMETCFIQLEQESLQLFSAILWWMWYNRNRVVFDLTCVDPKKLIVKIRSWMASLNGTDLKENCSNIDVAEVDVWQAPFQRNIKILWCGGLKP